LFQPERWVCFLLWVFLDHTSLVISNISLVTCTFDASRFEMAIIFCVPISLTVCTLSNIPLVFSRFKFNFVLFHILDIENILVIWLQVSVLQKAMRGLA
jgi:hypothetical protein